MTCLLVRVYTNPCGAHDTETRREAASNPDQKEMQTIILKPMRNIAPLPDPCPLQL